MYFFGPSQKQLGSLLYAKELCRDLSIRVPSQSSQLGGANVCHKELFWSGLRAKHDIIQGAWGRRVLQQERSHVSL